MSPNERIKKQQEAVFHGVPARPTVGDPRKVEQPSGFVVIRLSPEAGALRSNEAADTLAAHAKQHGLRRLSQVLEHAGSPESHRVVRSVAARKILEMEREAAHTQYPPLHSLTQYWRLDLRDRSREETAKLIEFLASLPEVDSIWDQPLVTLPAVAPGDDPYNGSQGYQDAAPVGIDARWMWAQPNGEGAGIGIVDVEGGWRTTHQDLAGKSPTLIHGVSYPSWEDHGTAVLGEIVAIDNSAGVVGTAPAINSIRMSSIYDSSGTQNVTDALAAAVAAMSVGEILLIELQVGYKPLETLDDWLDIIRLATARGIIVVEAAGNGNTNLDAWTTSGGLLRLNRTSAAFVDSGAIMVGASVSTVPHERWFASNYGSRIDCFAWGENVTTTGYGDLDNGGGNPDGWYTDTFQGTSSASPIIVSAAALVQSKYLATTGTRLSPGQMRVLLSNPATGTAQGTTVAGAIGVMPNLAAIVPALGLVPDVYLRDWVGDTGAIPWTGPICGSPDVIVRPSAVANAQFVYGEGSGTENSAALGDVVEFGQDNFIYVRVRNRGGAPSTNVVATVYWSPPSTLVTPSMWQIIGSVTIPAVPVGDVLTVSPALTWPKAGIPGTGHYCFVAILHHSNDPAPPIPSPLGWSAYYDLIRANNNVTWRNFNVENVLPDTPDAITSFAFHLTGAEDRARQFAFEVERKLPADAMLMLEGPLKLLVRLKGENPWELARSEDGKNARLTLPALPRIPLPPTLIGRGARLPCVFKIISGKTRVEYGHGVAIRQMYRNEEFGRINWQFAPEPCLCSETKKR